MMEVLQTAGLDLAPWEIRDMVRECDLNSDGKISFEEFGVGFETMPWTRARRLGENM